MYWQLALCPTDYVAVGVQSGMHDILDAKQDVPRFTTFDDVLDYLRAKNRGDKVALGRDFERLVCDFFKSDKYYSQRFSKVYMWNEWEGREGQDIGIDIVAREQLPSYKQTAKNCAIQCKCYDDNTTLSQDDVSAFIAEARADSNFSSMILVFTGEKISKHAASKLHRNKVQIITKDHFDESGVDWSKYPTIIPKSPKELKEYQKDAVTSVVTGFENEKHKNKNRPDHRGKLIMACGTGKTLVSLHIAENKKIAGIGGIVLYLVPSISLILQTMREWSGNASIPHNYIAVCSDKSVGGERGTIAELESPVSTNPDELYKQIRVRPKNAMTVVLSTYHSIEAIEDATKGMRFDVVFCDEAHRTTGVDDKKYFTRVHDEENIRADRRLYMTATPRIYSEGAKTRGRKRGKAAYSMDDTTVYGTNFYTLSFADAVHKYNALADFKVKIAVVEFDDVAGEYDLSEEGIETRDLVEKIREATKLQNTEVQVSVADNDNSLPVDERTLMAAVWHGIQYPDDGDRPNLLRKVITFCNRIDSSKLFAGCIDDHDAVVNRSFESVVADLKQRNSSPYEVKVRHIDGTNNALFRRRGMKWLQGGRTDDQTCRILSNARCLSEGVDVPALDGIVFLNPRKSQVDVVQSVGRVMRKVVGKEYGYVILPVAIPAGVPFHEALDDNKTFQVVWQVLNALRSHDERLESEISRISLDPRPSQGRPPIERVRIDIMSHAHQTHLPAGLFEKIYTKMVEKVGDINYYEKYGEKIGKIAKSIEKQIRELD